MSASVFQAEDNSNSAKFCFVYLKIRLQFRAKVKHVVTKVDGVPALSSERITSKIERASNATRPCLRRAPQDRTRPRRATQPAISYFKCYPALSRYFTVVTKLSSLGFIDPDGVTSLRSEHYLSEKWCGVGSKFSFNKSKFCRIAYATGIYTGPILRVDYYEVSHTKTRRGLLWNVRRASIFGDAVQRHCTLTVWNTCEIDMRRARDNIENEGRERRRRKKRKKKKMHD